MKSEKVTINLSAVELAQIDFLVDKGLYVNRSDFIRLATRKLTEEHQKEIEKFVDTSDESSWVTFGALTDSLVWTLGGASINGDYIKEVLQADKKLDIRVIGVLIVKKDVDPGQFRQALKRCKVFGKINAESEIKAIIEEFNQK